MFLPLELGMLVFGAIALATGKFRLSKTSALEGPPVRLIGFLLVLPIPLAFSIMFLVGFNEGIHGRPVVVDQWRDQSMLLEILVTLACLSAALVLLAVAERRSAASAEALVSAVENPPAAVIDPPDAAMRCSHCSAALKLPDAPTDGPTLCPRCGREVALPRPSEQFTSTPRSTVVTLVPAEPPVEAESARPGLVVDGRLVVGGFVATAVVFLVVLWFVHVK